MNDSIKVAIRMRPVKGETEKNETYWKINDPKSVMCISEDLSAPKDPITFDRVFDGHTDNLIVYEELCKPIVQCIMQGFNGTVFAYGQTSSGKTYTMMGEHNGICKGVIHCGIEDIFNIIETMPDREFLLRVSFLEIYEGKLYDLLSDKNNDVVLLGDRSGDIKIRGLLEKIVQTSDQVYEWIWKCQSKKKGTGKTKMNRSSRSHFVFRMIVESRVKNEENAVINVSHLNFIDLAGFENRNKKKSDMSSLAEVISQLSEKRDQHIKYRSSNLTRVLQNSLGGNCYTAVICTITPANFSETYSTLKFASSAKTIKIKPQKNVLKDDQSLLKNHANQIRRLSHQLEAKKRLKKTKKYEDLEKQYQDLKMNLLSQTAVNMSAGVKVLQSASHEITSVDSSAKNSVKEQTLLLDDDSACKMQVKCNLSPTEETHFILPNKYKLIEKRFNCMENIVRWLNIRKEKITFEKIKRNVEQQMNKEFLLEHLGQIMSVLPSAYILDYEKLDSNYMHKKSHQLIITPNLDESQNSIVEMTYQKMAERKNIFIANLIKIAKDNYQEFLKNLNFPSISDEKNVWRPVFVPDIPVSGLPQEPETKVYTAKDCLNKIKGSFRGSIEKSLQCVTEKQKVESKNNETVEAKKNTQNQKQNAATKGICKDLLFQVRKMESFKRIEAETRNTEVEKQLQIQERLPKIITILWDYCNSVNKSVMLLSAAIEKIRFNFGSLVTTGINKVTLLGRVGINPQVRGQECKQVVVFTLATNTNYKYDSGEIQQKTDWHRISVFKPHLKDLVLEYLKKGNRVYVEGCILYGEFSDSKGAMHYTTSIIANDIIFLGDRKKDDETFSEEMENSAI